MSYFDLPMDLDGQDEEDNSQTNIANIAQAALLAGSALMRRGGGGRTTAKAATQATKATKKKGVTKKTKKEVPKKELPKISSTPPSRAMSTGSFAPLVPLKEYTYSQKTKGDAARKMKAVIRKVEDIGAVAAKAASALKMKAKAGIQKVGKKAKTAATTGKVIRSEKKLAGNVSTIKSAAAKAVKQVKASVAKGKKAVSEAIDNLPSTYRAVKERLGLDSPGTFQTELQRKFQQMEAQKRGKSIVSKAKKGKYRARDTGSTSSLAAVERKTRIQPSDIRRVPKSEGIFMPGLSREYNKLKKKPTPPKRLKSEMKKSTSSLDKVSNQKGIKISRRMSK